MCSPSVCSRCKKITWTGCGRHVDQALAGVPPENRCTCRESSLGTGQAGGA